MIKLGRFLLFAVLGAAPVLFLQVAGDGFVFVAIFVPTIAVLALFVVIVTIVVVVRSGGFLPFFVGAAACFFGIIGYYRLPVAVTLFDYWMSAPDKAFKQPPIPTDRIIIIGESEDCDDLCAEILIRKRFQVAIVGRSSIQDGASHKYLQSVPLENCRGSNEEQWPKTIKVANTAICVAQATERLGAPAPILFEFHFGEDQPHDDVRWIERSRAIAYQAVGEGRQVLGQWEYGRLRVVPFGGAESSGGGDRAVGDKFDVDEFILAAVESIEPTTASDLILRPSI